MKHTQALILGGGISGLSLGYYLCLQDQEVALLEKSEKAGGWIGTERVGNFLFERGPRTFSVVRSEALLKLIRDLKLEQKLIFSDQNAEKRYLFFQNKLQLVPNGVLKFALSPLTRSLVGDVLKEWRVAPVFEEESVWQFASRRLGQKAAERLFDPLVLGIYAGDARLLSMDACFPFFKELERKYGSLTKGLLKQKRGKGSGGLFSLEGGMQILVDALVQHLGGRLQLQNGVKEFIFEGKEIEVRTQQQVWRAEKVFSALPSYVLAPLLAPHDKEIAALLERIAFRSVHVVSIGYDEDVLALKGFGYLVPSVEQEKILGVVFDSCIFPQHNCQKKETRLTIMVKDEAQAEEESVVIALEGLKRHMKIEKSPNVCKVWKAKEAIAQYQMGHLTLVAEIEQKIKKKFPGLHFLGSSFYGSSVNDCIKKYPAYLAGEADPAYPVPFFTG